MTLTITPIFAALLTFIYMALSWRTVRYRRANMISLGDSGDKALLKRMRAHSNFAEYTPLGLMLLLIAELQNAPTIALCVMGSALLLGRLLHAIGFSSTPQIMPLRVFGMVLTLMTLGLSSVALLVHTLL